MTISKEQIEAALKYLDIQWSGYQVLKETIRTVLQERLATYDQLNENGSQLNPPSEALEADGLLWMKQLIEDRCETMSFDQHELQNTYDEILATLQRNDVPQGWNTNMDEAPRDGSVVIIEDSFGHIQNYRWAGDVMGGCWQHQNCEETYSNPRFMKQWMPLPAAPKPTGV